ncbi:MAG: RelA/SpoT family protein [Anaerolineales bacterium]
MKLTNLLELLPANLSPQDKAQIEKAYSAAERAHAGQLRASGEPYVTHCLAVAMILADLHMPLPVIIAGLLHDTVEDTPLTLDEIRRDFGEEAAKLVDGVTKLAQLPRVSRDGNQPIDRNVESLRKTFLAMSDDIRVVIIKLADRLHNMRTLSYKPPEKQQRIAHETLEIFAPLANRLGIWKLKSELEDLSFRYSTPEKFREIASQLSEQEADRAQTIGRIITEVKLALREDGIECEVTGRPKHVYSIYRKMERKGAAFNDIYDWRAVRVLVKDKPTCYHTLGIIHSLWSPIPGQFDDYIATPKDNNYQSLHTGVLYTDGRPLEVQIRTPEMHEHAEYGIAAHWRYKEGAKRDDTYEKHIQWIRKMMEWRQEVSDASEFVDAMKRDVFPERVYCFTPRGDIFDMPAGATPIDFAYHVHTAIGHRCRGARVNGRLVSLDYRLKTGDQVEILTAKQGGPSRDWLNPDLNLVKSASALQKIKLYFRRQERDTIVAQGRAMLEKELKRMGASEFNQETLARKLAYARPEDLMYALGTGDIHGKHIASVVLEQESQPQEQLPLLPATLEPRRESPADEIAVLGTHGMLTRLATCCNPVPGDPIIGYITRGRGVTIHRQDCPNMLNSREPERKLKVSWGQAQRTYPVSVRITAYDRPGLMQDISTVMSNERINMSSVRSLTKGTIATIDLTMDLSDIAMLPRVLARVEQLPNVIEAYRPKAA